MKNYLIIIISFACFMISCEFSNAGEEVRIIQKYYVGWSDLESNRGIYLKETFESNTGQYIVDGYVFAVGNNSRYIIAKSLDNPNNKRTFYHIIDTKGYYNTNIDNNNYWEFSSETEFHQKLVTLKIDSLKFDKNYRTDPSQ